MNSNIKALVQACRNLGVNYNLYHSTNNVVEIELANKRWLFINWSTPLNSQSIVQLCQDKDYFYNYFKDCIKMPKTLAFYAPNSNKYREYLDVKGIDEIVDRVKREFSFPVVVKKNRGSWGRNVFKVENLEELNSALLKIFDKNSLDYDYVAVMQEYIEIKSEYRAVFLDGKIEFVYKKDFKKAKFCGNLSPLHWEGAVARFVEDLNKIEAIKGACRGIFEKVEIPFCGIDVVESSSGDYFVIEANSSPGFDKIIKHQGSMRIVKLYEKIIKLLTL